MVTFRRLFGPCRNPENPDAGSRRPTSKMTNMTSRSEKTSLTAYKTPQQPLDVEQHFEKIEKQFEELHDHLQPRPLSPSSQAPPSRGSSRRTGQSPRHVDLLEALFTSSQKYHVQSAAKPSHVDPYNENIAERNMTHFLQTQPPRKRNGVYSRIISALYQEDVADRNIAKTKGGRPWSRSTSSRSPRVATSSFRPGSRGNKGGNSRLGVERPTGNVSRSSSQENLRSRSRSQVDPPVHTTQETRSASPQNLRPQRSAPNLSAEANRSQKPPSPSPVGHLGVPPAHKQGDRWSTTPLPESPTLPIPMRRHKGGNENKPLRDSPPSPPPRHSPPLAPRKYSPPTSAPTSRKNVRDLSINTELAANGKAQITHRAIQPPTPSSCDAGQNPSIAEVMNSPLPAGTPTSISPLPTSQKLAEIMDMFKQAYATPALSPHPTFETLQDAIVREINSHEAFKRVPIPDQGPPFTPSPTEGSFDWKTNVPKSPGNPLSRTSSSKESQFSKLIRRGSFKKHHRRGSEMRKSISTSIPSKGVEKFKRSIDLSSRRRHTDAPPPSPGFFDSMETPPQPQREATQPDQVTYMDLLQSVNQQKQTPKKVSDFGIPKDLGHSQSVGTLASHSFSDGSSTAPSVYYMRAQTSASSIDGRPSLSADDDDDDVIQLPSVGVPSLQIQGVDDNNVQYVVKNSTPTDAYRLMNWPRKSRTLHQSSSKNPLHQIRGVRSVESY